MTLASKDYSLMYFRRTPVCTVAIRSGDLFSQVSHSVGAEILFAEYETITNIDFYTNTYFVDIA